MRNCQEYPLFGLLNLHKPAGATSRDVVNLVQRLVRPHKVGHAGTLDPLATGVLVVGVGSATRLVEYVQRMPKEYTATFLLGRQSDTEDIEGDMHELVDPPRPACDDIAARLPAFLGRIAQRPPAYSALKLAGKRAYKLARAGKEVALAPREIEVHAIEIVAYDYPRLVLYVNCGSGTYVRSLGRDIAAALGTAAVMAELVRTAIGEFRLSAAIDPQELSPENIAAHLLPPELALSGVPRLRLSPDEAARIARGQTIERGDVDAGEMAAFDLQQRLVAMVEQRSPGLYGPVRNFLG